MITNLISKSLEFIHLLICKKIAEAIFIQTKLKEKKQRYSNTKNAFRCQIPVLRDYRFQFNIKILFEGVIIKNLISKSLEFIELLIYEKISGVIFV